MLASMTFGLGKDQETVALMDIWRAEYDNVGEASETLPGFLAWLSYKKGEAIEVLENAERMLDEAEAEAYFELRSGGFETNGFAGKPTEEALKKATCLVPAVRAAAAKVEKYKGYKEQVIGVIMGIQAKLDLVRTTEATKRRIQEPTPVRDDEVG